MHKTNKLPRDICNFIAAKYTDGIGYRRICTVGAIILKWKEHYFTIKALWSLNRPHLEGCPRSGPVDEVVPGGVCAGEGGSLWGTQMPNLSLFFYSSDWCPKHRAGGRFVPVVYISMKPVRAGGQVQHCREGRPGHPLSVNYLCYYLLPFHPLFGSCLAAMAQPHGCGGIWLTSILSSKWSRWSQGGVGID